MTARVVLAVLMATGVTHLAAGWQAPSGQVFRATTDLVTIDVMVRANGTPVAGLTAADFLLTDNGVPQAVEAVELEAVPIDVSIVVDTSQAMDDDIGGLTRQARLIAGLARPTDRIRLMAAGTYVEDLIPAVEAGAAPEMPELTTAGAASAYDALAAAMLRPVPQDRRHLVVAMMNGIDAMSAIDAPALLDIARRSSATLNVAQVDLAIEGRVMSSGIPRITSGQEREIGDRCRTLKVCQPSRHFWVPYDERQFEVLGEAAAMTGGEVYFPSLFTVASASAIFRRAFEDYRQSYLLRYTPTGIPREGWHDVVVTLPDRPDVEVRARRGYAVDPEPAPGTASRLTGFPAPDAPEPAAMRPGAPVLPSNLPESADEAAAVVLDTLVALYERGDYADAFTAMTQVPNGNWLIRHLEVRGNPWPARPHLESAFVLDLAHAMLLGSRRGSFRLPNGQVVSSGSPRVVSTLLLDHARRIRHPIDPDRHERDWFLAAIGVTQNANVWSLTTELADAALARFPDEPRFHLARAVALDQRNRDSFELQLEGARITARASSRIDDALELYDVARGMDDVAAEAAVRQAWLLYRLGRHTDALALLEAVVPPADDPLVAYHRELFLGLTRLALDRPADAAAAFRAALGSAPQAQSARVGLMNSLMLSGDRDGAAGVAAAIETAPTDAFDPWWAYWSGDYRFYTSLVAPMRGGTR